MCLRSAQLDAQNGVNHGVSPYTTSPALNIGRGAEVFDRAKGTDITNQGVQFSKDKSPVIWNNLKFRSLAEVDIAKALERVKVLFLPNCRAWLGLETRENREADFLICYEGRWGILEIDHPFSHPPSKIDEDRERDRRFEAHGIRLVERFSWRRCREEPDTVVEQFLMLLKNAG